MMGDRRIVLRVLRFLGRGEAVLEDAAADGMALLDGGERGTLGVAVGVLNALQSTGQISIDGDRVSLTPEGKLALKEEMTCSADPLGAQAPEEGASLMTDATGTQAVTVNLAESPLGLLWQRRNRKGERFLTPAEFRAGERLRSDYTRGQIMPRLGINWTAAGGSSRKSGDANGMVEMTDAALAARRRVERAIEAVGPELSGILIDICCFLKGFELVETERGWPVRSAKVVLKSALSALARHYEPPKQSTARTLLHWGAEDYRPSL